MNAEQAKIRNIIDMAIGFGAMTRVFEEDSIPRISDKLESVLPQIGSSRSEQDFRNIHDGFCRILRLLSARGGMAWFSKRLPRHRMGKVQKYWTLP